MGLNQCVGLLAWIYTATAQRRSQPVLMVAFALAVIAMVAVKTCFIVVPRDGAYVVERLGAYRDTIVAGLNVIAPFIDRIAFRYTLLPQERELSDVCITKDNESVKVTSSYRWRIVDPRRFAYNTADGAEFVASLVREHHRKWIGSRSLNEARESVREMEASVLTSVADAVREVGAEIVSANVYAIASTGREP